MFMSGYIWYSSSPGGTGGLVTSVQGQIGAVSLSSTDIPEGTNLYFIDARARTAVITQVITNGVLDRSPSEDAIYDALQGYSPVGHTHVAADITDYNTAFDARFDTQLATKDTDDLAQGVTNLYYATSLFNTDFAAQDTDGLAEGVTNLYYTDTRARAAFSAGTDISISGLGVISSTYSYTLPIASAGTLGGIKVGAGLTIDGGGVLDAIGAVASVFGRTGAVVAVSGDYDTDEVTEGVTNLYFTDARARGAVAGSGVISYSSLTGIFSMAAATTSVSGYLTSADWNTFNSKQAALTIGNASTSTTGVNLAGASGAVIGAGLSIDIDTATNLIPGLLSAADWITFNGKQSALTFGNFSTSNAAITIVSGNSSTVGPNVTIDIANASASVIGLLTNTDWSTFNGKQNALTFGNLSSSTTGVTVVGGTAAVIGSGTTVDIQNATTAQPGLLTSTDWNTFNGKMSSSQVAGEGTFTTTITSTGAIHQQQVFTGSSDQTISVLPTPVVSTYMTIVNNGTAGAILTMSPTHASGGFFGSQVELLANECCTFIYNLNAAKWFKV